TIVDAALHVLATQGARGLTHRSVDQHANVPMGTCSNYFRNKHALYVAMGDRIFERLTPPPKDRAESATAPPSVERFQELMHELMDRVRAQPALQLALLELRLEATRRPELREGLVRTLSSALSIDLEFHAQAGLPGGRRELVLLHLGIGGLILNLVTMPEVLGLDDPHEILDDLVRRILDGSERA
ncbi:MAG: TetR family transcriptional regulator, partial [Myxococcota bacterium]